MGPFGDSFDDENMIAAHLAKRILEYAALLAVAYVAVVAVVVLLIHLWDKVTD